MFKPNVTKLVYGAAGHMLCSFTRRDSILWKVQPDGNVTRVKYGTNETLMIVTHPC